MHSLALLLDKGEYIDFMRRIASGELPVPERDEWLGWVGGDVGKLERILTKIGEKLWEKARPVVYPVEMVVVPRYPLSKAPMVRWSMLKTLPPEAPEVARLKEYAGRLGSRINAGFLLRRFILIDIDAKPDNLRKLADIETRRGYHIIRFLEDADAVAAGFGGSPSTKMVVVCGNVRVEIASGPNYLGSHPLQSRFLVYEGGKFNVRRYKLLSRDASIAFQSADLTPITIKTSDVKDLLCSVLRELGCESRCGNLTVEPASGTAAAPNPGSVATPRSRFNQAPLHVVGLLTYDGFKERLSKYQDALPVCLREALFGSPRKGYRWFHLRLLLAIVPYFVLLDDEELERLVEDFSARTASTPGDTRKWLYDSKYFTGVMKLGESEVRTASKLGVPQEAWDAFRELGYCERCPLRETCANARSGAARRRAIIDYISKLIELEG